MTTKNSIFTSVISGSPTITSEKLIGSENYLSWSASVELWFLGQGYEDHLITPEDDIPGVDKVHWKKIDAQLCSVLWQSVDPKILLHLRAYKTCSKFWTQAKALYTNDIQRLYKVASAIVNIRQQDMDLSNYIGQIASLKEEFLTLMPLTSDVGAQQTQVDKFFMVLTLIGLRPDLETLRDQILGSPSVPSLDDVFARLLRISSTQTLPSDSPLDSSVLVSTTNLRGGRSGTRGRGQRPHCSYCNKLGHTRDRCYQLHGRPPRTAHVAQSSDSNSQSPQTLSSCTSQGVPPTDSEYDAYLRYQAAKSASVASVAQTGNASACLTHTSSLGPWILDSGASDHISGNKDLFSSLTTTPTLPTVTLANGSQTVAKGIGLAHPLPSLPLTSVLYTPECPFNLISISKITRTLNCSIIFSDKFVTLQDRSTGKTIGIGCESQGLYHLTSQSSPAVCVSTDAPLLIHSRLGHPSLSKFQKMVPRFSTLSSLACESCQLGKHTRVSFPQRLNNRATSPFDLVHTDVWGPCRTASTLGFQYFVTFIDDYSRCTWLFLMKTRAELFSIFQKFYAEILTQFNISIRVLRSDNAREYFSAPFISFMSQHGILHQSSCAHIPQQNGVAERKNRHLIETARTLLLHYHVPFRFWGDAVLTACYLINRMPSSVLHAQIPHSLLFPDQPLYFLPPRVFGCTCFVHILTPGKDKLSAKATKCIFKLVPGQGESFGDPGRYRRLVGKLNYLTITRPDISFPVSVVSQFLQSPCDSHWDAVIRILRYIKSTPGQGVLYENRGHTQVIGYTDADWAGSPTDRRSTSGYCVFIGGNLISWKSKKQHVVARSSAEAEYRAMALATCELIWLRHLLQELRFGKDEQMKLIRDNQAALHIASNPVFHERTKHIEVDCHFIREKIASGCIATSFVNSNDQLADIFTKSLRGPRIKYICNKLGAYDIYAPA